MFKARFTKADAPELVVGLEPWLFDPVMENPVKILSIKVLSGLGVWGFLGILPRDWIPPGVGRKTQRTYAVRSLTA